MSCEHEVRFTIKPTDDACRFHFDVRAYKDRIVAPDEYSGATVVTPSHIEQVLPTTDKLVREDITINPAPTEYLSTDHNGTFVPSDGHVGFSQVDVDVQPDLRPLSVTENGTYEPDGFDGYSGVSVDVPAKRLIGEYVLSVNKLNIADHESYWLENYLPAEQDPTAIYIIEFEQNNAPNYAVKKIIVPGLIGGTFSMHNACIAYRYVNGVLIRYGIYINRDSDSTRTLNATKGTVIKVYEAYNKISI